jgi:hypothetical protein
MQTFLPYADFVESARCLDYRRLGKQRVEAMQLHNILTNRTTTKGWRSHPALKMWEGYAPALAHYMNVCIDEWVRRGYKNTMEKRDDSNLIMPPWLNDYRIWYSHRANLIRKDPHYYSQFNWGIDSENAVTIEYYWPVQ